MIAAHFPILQVVVPLLAAPLCVLVRQRDAAWGLALAATWISLAISLLLITPVPYVLFKRWTFRLR